MEKDSSTSSHIVDMAAAASADNKDDQNEPQKIARVFKSEFDAKYNIVDISTPTNAYMSGQYKRSYAYYVLRNRLPVVLTNVIDTFTKDKNELVAQFAPANFVQSAREELKIIIGLISRLKYELQTDKLFQHFTGDEPDRDIWNSFITHLPEEECTFFKACWLHSECYMYRKLYSFVENSIFLKQFDFFGKVKEQALFSCIDDILSLAKYTRRTESSLDVFTELLTIDLWSNRNDFVALTEEKSEQQRGFNSAVMNDIAATVSLILVNDTAQIWNCLNTKHNTKRAVDFVLNNVGYELFTDFILAEYMIEKGLATKVRFHVKAHPWFVCDTTARDFHWTLQYLSEHSDYIISLVGKKFLQFLDEGKFELAPTSHFWTAPHAFCSMIEIAPELYKMLQQSRLIIFKGDLNYRKLLSDVCWGSTHNIQTCSRSFQPSNFCCIRTFKSEIMCGLPDGISDELSKKDPQWMVTGNYGVIQFVDDVREFGY